MKNLIVWPEAGGKFSDTEDGGMRAYALFGCTDKTYKLAGVHILKPPVITGELDLDETDVFPNYHLVESNPNIEQLLSKAFCAVVSLGTTPHSLWNESPGEYFAITRGSLTRDGENVVRTLESTYGEEALFLTCISPNG